jgi:DNA-binding transcriptional MocR family regulator
LTFDLNRERTIALYLQIAEQIKDQISTQQLPVGARLPTIRQLADELGVTRVTVQNAYDELQAGGWIEATIGRGTFVSQQVQTPALPRSFGQGRTPDAVINDILQINETVGVRSLASASPDPSLFPAEEFATALDSLRPALTGLVSYGPSQGMAALRIELTKLLHERAIQVMPDDILVTAGATQALSLVTQALCRPGDAVLVEQPTYLGFLHTLKAHGVQPTGIPLDAEGPQLEVVERYAMQQRPRFFYTIPTFQNPTGGCLSVSRRKHLLALAARYGFLLVEDDIYARLAYDQPAPPPLFALDETHSVIYLCSFSKTLMPSLRVGYLVAPPSLQPKLVSLRRAADLCGSSLLQVATAHFLADGGLKRHLRRVLPIYRERRDTLLAAMQQHMPATVSWTQPSGGYCIWVTLPRQRSFHNLYQAAIGQGWIFAPGDAFLSEPQPQAHLRICFGNQPPATIRSGVELLGRLIRAELNQTEHPLPTSADWAPLV